MKKPKISIPKIGKYFREISVVIIGVAITLSATLWISKKNEKRDMNLYLNAIKIELEENITTMNRCIEYLQPDVEYEKYLKTRDKESLNEDTLAYYANTCYTLRQYAFKTNAFEMFKSSGIMRLMDDKELLLSIWDIYTDLVSLNEALKWYFDTKWGHMEKDFLFVESGKLDFSKLRNGAPMYIFYNSALSSSTMESFDFILKETKETVSKLEKRK
jgi:hypothetical protein